MELKFCAFGTSAAKLHRPFKTALREVHQANDFVVKIKDSDGREGWGSAAATPVITGSTHGSMEAVLRDILWPALRHQYFHSFNDALDILHESIQGHTSIKAAVESALWDLHAQSLNLPLVKALGGGIKRTLKTDITISIGTPQEMANNALAAMQQGFLALKIKLSRDAVLDCARMKCIKEAVGSEILLRVDVNQGWNYKETLKNMDYFEKNGIQLEFLEQPVSRLDMVSLKKISERSSVPIVADESANTLHEVAHLLSTDSVDIINIKLMKCGGISQALKIAHLCEGFDKKILVSCMLETSLGIAAAAHFAASLPSGVLIDLDAAHLASENPVDGGIEFVGPQLCIQNTPGLGIRSVPNFKSLGILE